MLQLRTHVSLGSFAFESLLASRHHNIIKCCLNCTLREAHSTSGESSQREPAFICRFALGTGV